AGWGGGGRGRAPTGRVGRRGSRGGGRGAERSGGRVGDLVREVVRAGRGVVLDVGQGDRRVGLVGAHVQPEVGERVHAGGGERGGEDRVVGERVAVDLAGRRARQVAQRRARGDRAVHALEVVVPLAAVQRAGERDRRVDPAAQPRQPLEHHVEL